MRILFLSTVYPSRTAPTRGTYTRALCRALSESCDVRVVSPVSWMEALRHGRTEAADPTDPVPVTRPIFWYPPRMQHHRHGKWMWRSIRRHTEQVIRDFTPDWVLSYWAHPDGEAALNAARLCGARVAVAIGGSDVLLITRDARRREAVSHVLRNMDLIFTVCDGLRERVIELGGNPAHSHTSFQGIDTDCFYPGSRQSARESLGLPPSCPLFLWVGRMVPVKRIDVLLAAFTSVLARLPEARLVLAGSGPLADSLKTRVRNEGLEHAVCFAGPVEPGDLAAWYRAADATVLSSDSEGLPNVLRESLACGTPFVSTDAGSVREIAADEYSRTVRCGDVDALQQAMIEILDSSFQDGARAYQPRSWAATAAERLQLMREFDQQQRQHQATDSARLLTATDGP